MKKRNLFATSTMALIMGATSVGGAFAAPLTEKDILKEQAPYTENVAAMGVGQHEVNLGAGAATITINQTNQFLNGKTFKVFNLMTAINATDKESIDYRVNPKYLDTLKELVAPKLGKTADEINEYHVIDYMSSLRDKQIEPGADVAVPNESSESALRKFLEEAKTAIQNAGLNAEHTVAVPALLADKSVNAFSSVKLTGLEFGYFLIDEVTTTGLWGEEDNYFSNALIMTHTANPDAVLTIKGNVPEVIKKIQEDSTATQLGDTTGGIGTNGWNDVGDFEIGQTIPYAYQAAVPDMNGYQQYFFAFHDELSGYQKLDGNSIKVVLRKGTKDASTVEKEFAKGADYQVSQVDAPAVTGVTKMSITFNDLKALVDGVIGDKADGNHDVTTYGEYFVEVQYNAEIKDEAQAIAGQGMENKVQLEFSNNPKSGGEGDKGRTPWDTVVSFTYRLDGVKTNEQNKKLQDAHFRLFRDEDGLQEIPVKAGANDGDYVVDASDDAEPGVDIISVEEGVFNIIGLDAGVYYLKETKAPDGYRALAAPIKLDLRATHKDSDKTAYVIGNHEKAGDKTLQALEGTATIKTMFAGVLDEADNQLQTAVDTGTYNLTVINKRGTKLPVTGSQAMLIMTILAGGSIGTGFVIGRKKKKEEVVE